MLCIISLYNHCGNSMHVHRVPANKASKIDVIYIFRFKMQRVQKTQLSLSNCIYILYILRNLKPAIVTPVPKKLNSNEFSNFRPISNLSFLSKLIEQIVVDQLSIYTKNNDLEEPLQSAYKTGYSTETALLKITNDILLNMDQQRVTLLVLLDMSAAFDTIPHHLFLSRIKSTFGVSGTAHQWFRSYFEDRYQRVTINGELSEEMALEIGLPKGAGAGPFGYKVYTRPIGSLIRKLSTEVLFHMFADDNQLHRSLSPKDPSSQVAARSDLETS